MLSSTSARRFHIDYYALAHQFLLRRFYSFDSCVQFALHQPNADGIAGGNRRGIAQQPAFGILRDRVTSLQYSKR